MSENRALITGICGFSGRCLGVHLMQHHYVVFGVDLAPSVLGADVPVSVGDIYDRAFV